MELSPDARRDARGGWKRHCSDSEGLIYNWSIRILFWWEQHCLFLFTLLTLNSSQASFEMLCPRQDADFKDTSELKSQPHYHIVAVWPWTRQDEYGAQPRPPTPVLAAGIGATGLTGGVSYWWWVPHNQVGASLAPHVVTLEVTELPLTGSKRSNMQSQGSPLGLGAGPPPSLCAGLPRQPTPGLRSILRRHPPSSLRSGPPFSHLKPQWVFGTGLFYSWFSLRFILQLTYFYLSIPRFSLANSHLWHPHPVVPWSLCKFQPPMTQPAPQGPVAKKPTRICEEHTAPSLRRGKQCSC